MVNRDEERDAVLNCESDAAVTVETLDGFVNPPHEESSDFDTHITDVSIGDETVKAAFLKYLEVRAEVHGGKKKPVTLMDIATLGTKYLKQRGLLETLDESGDACAVKIKVKIDDKYRAEDYILYFESETYLGGGIRDPRSGRAYFYPSTRIVGATPLADAKRITVGDGGLQISHDYGTPKQMAVEVARKNSDGIFSVLANKIKDDDIKTAYINLLSDLNICSQKGIVEQFGSSSMGIGMGSGTVISPLGGALRLSPSQYTAEKIPVLNGSTNTSSVMAHGFSPYVSELSPYHGAIYAVVESISKLIAAGVNLKDIYLTFREYFPGINNDPKRFGVPFEAVFGTFTAQLNLEVGSVGGSYSHDSEAGDIPPTLVSFAVGTSDAEKILSNEFKKPSSYVYFLKPDYNGDNIIDFEDLKNLYAYVTGLIDNRVIKSAYAVGFGGIGEAIFMCVGNGIGFVFDENITQNKLFSSFYGSFIVETDEKIPNGELLGKTSSGSNININNSVLNLNELTNKWLLPLEDIFPTELNKIREDIKTEVPPLSYFIRPQSQSQSQGFANPRVVIPLFNGTGSEYDAAKKFEQAGASVDTPMFRNTDVLSESVDILADKIRNSQIFMLTGGLPGIDESGFIETVLRSQKIADALDDLINIRNGLILGIGSGFQILVRLGLLPYGKIINSGAIPENGMTISVNRIGRHQSCIAYTRVASVNSPWFSEVSVNDVYALPICHSEGRVCVGDDFLRVLIKNGQIAAQYADINGNPTMHPYYNPNASVYAIEGIFSPDGRIFGKMGHSDRTGRYIMKNVSANTDQKIFEAGVKYFR